MNKFKFQALCKEFEWLKGLLVSLMMPSVTFSVTEIESILVKRIDENLLRRVLYDDTWAGVQPPDMLDQKLFAVMSDGEVKKVPAQTAGQYWEYGNLAEEWEGQPLLEALAGFEETRHLVLVSGHPLTGQPYEIEIYKPARRLSLRGEIVRERIRQSARVRAESKF